MFDGAFGNDTVEGNFDGEDLIVFDDAGVASFDALQALMAEVDGNVEITLGDHTLTLANTDLASLDAQDFIFA